MSSTLTLLVSQPGVTVRPGQLDLAVVDARSRAARLRAQADMVPALLASAYVRRAVELDLEATSLEDR